jgi:hypothetical protein
MTRGIVSAAGLAGAAAALDRLDWQESVKDKDLTAPPGGESIGDRYIVAAVASGLWTGHEDDIAEYNGGGWDFITPDVGFAAWVEDETEIYYYFGGSWQLKPMTSHALDPASGPHTGALPEADVTFAGTGHAHAGAADGKQIAHSSTTGQTADDHHAHANKAQIDLVSDGDHDVRSDNPHGVTAGQAGASPVGHLHTHASTTGQGTDDHHAKNHAAEHVDGTQDIQLATALQKGLMSAAYAAKLDGVSAGAKPGDVVGPASATDNRAAVWDGATGKLLRDSLIRMLSDGRVGINDDPGSGVFLIVKGDDTQNVPFRFENARSANYLLQSIVNTAAGNVGNKVGFNFRVKDDAGNEHAALQLSAGFSVIADGSEESRIMLETFYGGGFQETVGLINGQWLAERGLRIRGRAAVSGAGGDPAGNYGLIWLDNTPTTPTERPVFTTSDSVDWEMVVANLAGAATGDILYKSGTEWKKLAKPASEKYLKNDAAGVPSWDTPTGGAVEIKDWIPQAEHPLATTGGQVLYNSANMQGATYKLDRDVTLNRISLHSGVSLSGTFTARLCIYQATDGGGGTSWAKVIDTTFTNTVGANNTFDLTVAETTLKAGVYAIVVGRVSGSGSPWLESHNIGNLELFTTGLPSASRPTNWSGVVSAGTPPATVNPTTQSASTTTKQIMHRFKKV